MVRPFVRTGGRVRPSRPEVRLESLVLAATGPADGLLLDHRRVLVLTQGVRGGLAVADIAASLALPPSTVLILVCDLMDSGHLSTPVNAREDQPEIDILREVLRGLRTKV
ncbi:hypothetical protein ADK55_06555 [Streptomyces sp. WM4235]|uniref:DUF742 domain-containing protein n=1 Tax=Streptomyces sp. WM4235 TaxID=1415551 RepID=UPI0006B00F2D|nr:DUF742 domain-containing protein [Streptomyces sp. WM4235]KOU65952.1 hypothetical protein ADK55_06555 [Streptomyces sp. WM4235]